MCVRVKTSGKELYDRLSKIEPLVKSRTASLESSSRILFTCDGERFSLFYFNGTTGVTDSFEGVDFQVSGAVERKRFLVDATTLTPFLKTKKRDIEIIVEDNNTLIIKHSSGSFEMAWENADKYPTLYREPETDAVILKSSYFVPVLKRSFAFLMTDEDYASAGLTSVHVEAKNGVIDVVSTDRFKMYLNRKKVEGTGDFSLNISRGVADILYGYTSKEDTDIRVSNDGSRTFFSFHGVVIYTQDMVGKFPNYGKVFDGFTPSLSADVDKDSLKNAMDGMSVTDFDCLELNILCHSIGITNLNTEKRLKIQESIPVISFSGEEAESVVVGRENTMTALRSVTGTPVTIEYSSANKMVRFRTKEDEDSTVIISSYFRGYTG